MAKQKELVNPVEALLEQIKVSRKNGYIEIITNNDITYIKDDVKVNAILTKDGKYSEEDHRTYVLLQCISPKDDIFIEVPFKPYGIELAKRLALVFMEN